MNRYTLKLLKSPPLSLIFKTPWIGVYKSFATALAAIPHESRIGYDQAETKAVFRTYPTVRVRSADYAFMLHLRNIAKSEDRLVDFGGNIGMAYYTALKYFPLPDSFEWTVCDVPQVLEAGCEVAARESEAGKRLRFVTWDSLKNATVPAANFNIFVSSGTLQYIEAPLSHMLKELPSLPETLLINRIPTWDRAPMFSVQDIGFCICPYQIFNHQDFVASILELGYKLVDEWSCLESTFSVRFRPGIRLDRYHGFYFARK